MLLIQIFKMNMFYYFSLQKLKHPSFSPRSGFPQDRYILTSLI